MERTSYQEHCERFEALRKKVEEYQKVQEELKKAEELLEFIETTAEECLLIKLFDTTSEKYVYIGQRSKVPEFEEVVRHVMATAALEALYDLIEDLKDKLEELV